MESIVPLIYNGPTTLVPSGERALGRAISTSELQMLAIHVSNPTDLPCQYCGGQIHYSDVITSTMVSQITSASIIYSTICSGADRRKHQSFASLAFVRGIHWWPVNSPHKGPVMWKMFPFDDIIMNISVFRMRSGCRNTFLVGFPTQRASDKEIWCSFCC